MDTSSQTLRERAIAAYHEYPQMIHGWSGVSFHLTRDEGTLLSQVIYEQEEYCEDVLSGEWFRIQSDDPDAQFLYNKILPQIQVARDVLRELRNELSTQIRLSDQGVFSLRPTRLQITFLLQTIEWMDIFSDHDKIVPINRFRLKKKFQVLDQFPGVQFDFWLCSEYINQEFGLMQNK